MSSRPTPPSFDSFPPTFSSFPELKDSEEDGDKKQRRRRDKDEKRDKDEERKRKKQRRGDDHKRRKEGEESLVKRTRRHEENDDHDDDNARFNPRFDLEDTRPRYYIEDGKGDQDNLRFGRLSSSSLPKYSQYGYAVILGVSKGWKAKLRKEFEVYSTTTRREGPRYGGRSWAAALTSSRPRRIVPLTEIDPHTDFISLGTSIAKKDALADQEYRSITKPKTDDHSASGSEDEDEADRSDHENTIPPNLINELNAKLSQNVKSNPSSIQNWLDLLAHTISEAPTSDARSEIAISILEKSFSAHPSNKRNPILRTRYLLAADGLWATTKLAEEWDRALRDVDVTTGSLRERSELWMAYVLWTLRSAGVGGLEDAVKDIRIVLNREPPSVGRSMFELRLLWRCAVALMEAGYAERAYACFQAQIELSIFKPSTPTNMSFETKLESLGEFWDSEVPRVGEDGARGWSSSSTDPSPPINLPPPPTQPVVPNAGLTLADDPYVTWSEMEQQRDNLGRLPLRTSSNNDADDDADDPFACILFTDIRSFLFNPSTRLDPALSVYAFLHFIGLYFPGLSSFLVNSSSANDLSSGNDSPDPSIGNDLNWSDTRFKKSTSSPLFAFSPDGDADRSWEVVNGVVVGKERDIADGWGPVKEWGWRTRSPLKGHGVRGQGRQWEESDVKGLDHQFIRRVFEQCSSTLKLAAFDEHWLAFEAGVNLKNALKLSKDMLSKEPNSLVRWSFHARLERIRGRIGDARKIYKMAVGSLTVLHQETHTEGAETMFWDWAEMEWLDGQTVQSEAIIVRATNASISTDTMAKLPATSILKAKRSLGQRIQQLITSASDIQKTMSVATNDLVASLINPLVALINLLALLELLSGDDAYSALAHYTDQSYRPPNLPRTFSSNLTESLAIASSQLLFHYTKTLKAPISPSVLRNHVHAAVQSFRGNTIILGMWLESERGETVWGRVRQMMNSVILEPSTLDATKCLWSIWQETRDKMNWNWEISRVRSTLGKGIGGNDRSRYSVTLWRVAVGLELGLGQVLPAKEILYRAIRQCPWAKELYVLAFTPPLRQAFTSKELDQLTSTLSERGIRIRVSLEDILPLHQTTIIREDVALDVIGSGREDLGDDDLEWNARERVRLMPF